MKKSTMIFLLSLTTIFGCEKNQTGYIPTPTAGDLEKLKHFQILQIDYDSLIISNHSNFIVESKFINKIILGELSNGIIVDSDSITPVYVPQNENYLVSFSLNKNVDIRKFEYSFGIKYLLVDASSVLLDTLIQLYKYPYESTEIVLQLDELSADTNLSKVQDFDIIQTGVVFHPFGPMGVYHYAYSTNITNLLFGYVGGDYISCNLNYAFLDINSIGIARYNFQSDSLDIVFDLTQLPFPTELTDDVRGIDVYQDTVYSLIKNSSTRDNHLVIFDLEANYQSDIIIPHSLFYLCIDKQFMYGYEKRGEDNYRLIVYDITTQKLVESLPSPAPHPLGIRISENKLYYIDYHRKILCYINK